MRRTFKDFLKTDVNTFINPNEFGEPVLINGLPALVVIDDDELEKRNLSMSKNTDIDRLSKSDLLFYIASDFFEHVPQPNKQLDFNNKKYRIDTVSNEMGILTIVLSRYTG